MGPILQGRGKLRHTKTERAAYVRSSTSQDSTICLCFCILGNPRRNTDPSVQTPHLAEGKLQSRVIRGRDSGETQVRPCLSSLHSSVRAIAHFIDVRGSVDAPISE